MSFSLGGAVGDVAWSPLSATTFAAVTEDGLARVFDLSQNANEPLCEQRVAAKAGLTRVSFSSTLDVLLIGDDRSVSLISSRIAVARKMRHTSLKDDIEYPRIAARTASLSG